MAEEDNSQEKTEEPSQRKLDKASEDGQVLSSKEMFVFTSLIMGLMVLSLIPFFARDFLAIWKTFFLFDLDYITNMSPAYGMNTLGLPGIFAPKYQECFTVGKSVLLATEFTSAPHFSAEFVLASIVE